MTRRTNDGKVSFTTYVYGDLAEQVRSLDDANTDVLNRALEMYFRSLGDVKNIEAERRELEREREIHVERRDRSQSRIDEIDEELAQLDVIEQQWEDQRESYEEIVETIAQSLAENPFETIDAYSSELADALTARSPDGEGDRTRSDVIDDVRSYAEAHELALDDDQLPSVTPDSPATPTSPTGPDVTGRSDQPTIVADGAGDDEPEDVSYDWWDSNDEDEDDTDEGA